MLMHQPEVPMLASIIAAAVFSLTPVTGHDGRPGVAARDPFAPYMHNAVTVDPRCADIGADNDVACVPLDELRLTAIVTATATPRAMFEDKAGKSHMVRVNDVVSGLRVKAIRRGVVVVERRLMNSWGSTSKADVELHLQ